MDICVIIEREQKCKGKTNLRGLFDEGKFGLHFLFKSFFQTYIKHTASELVVF